ncbi:GntR family transcriptional regulator [Rhodococcus sp. KRD162]|uniref:GntR family transcriptional regulator n=1 Tax=Rhodococcus sp. KRD162 TaxID=2729725 RepID=UPI0019D1CD9D|nr:GntR family transcriptional regulator [Rhodococcus sp. KRD162]
MRIRIDSSNATPVFEQLRMQILGLVRSGELIAGTKIPTVRGLAEELKIAPNTVAKTYRELEQQGVIETRGRSGSFVASGGDPSRDIAARAATEFVKTVRSIGLDDEQARAFVDAALKGADGV